MTRTGGCACGALRYEVDNEPMFLQACHCTGCQTSTGSAFIMTWMTESSNFRLVQGEPKVFDAFTGSSGETYDFNTCGRCGTGLWANIKGCANGITFLRAGTLDDTRDISPMAHIYTKSKQNWMLLPEDVPCFDEAYAREELWPPESLARLAALPGD